MGYHTELNTLLRFPAGYDLSGFQSGAKYSITRERERFFPLHLAILTVTDRMEFLGYSVVNSLEIRDGNTVLNFEVLSVFTPEEQAIYTKRYMEAGKMTGELEKLLGVNK
jgi:hypothetical protein